MSVQLLLVILLVLLVVGGLPVWPYASWGYGPSGFVGILLVVLLVVLIVRGRI